VKKEISGKQDVYLDIADKFEQYILAGIYRNGDKLPSVRVAAGDLGVNPNTVAKAYSVLEEKQLIHTLSKKGAYVTYSSDDQKGAADLRPLLEDLKRQGVRYDDLISQAKEVFEK
jgi:GntR family transcriptional regulator